MLIGKLNIVRKNEDGTSWQLFLMSKSSSGTHKNMYKADFFVIKMYNPIKHNGLILESFQSQIFRRSKKLHVSPSNHPHAMMNDRK